MRRSCEAQRKRAANGPKQGGRDARGTQEWLTVRPTQVDPVVVVAVVVHRAQGQARRDALLQRPNLAQRDNAARCVADVAITR